MNRSAGSRPLALAWAGIAVLALPPALRAQAGSPPFSAVERWLAGDQVRGESFDAALAELFADTAAGCAWLGGELGAKDVGHDRGKGLEMLMQHFVLEYLNRQRRTGMRFAGQYTGLAPLQPHVGEFLCGLLLETPQWFPHPHRVRLVPALRDLYPRSPGEPLVGRVLAMAENDRLEPEPLRCALAAMLWQWGVRDPAAARVDALRAQSADGDVEDRVLVLLELAELQYVLREYADAAATYRNVVAMADAAELPLTPLAHYQSACNHALADDVDRGIAALQRCAAMQASPRVDGSLKLERGLFERDPEIAVLRGDPRFAAILAEAFPDAPTRGDERR